MKPSRSGPCGLYCGACGAPDCDGCRSDRTDDSVRNCRFKTCADGRGHAFCGDCAEYPCAPLAAFASDEWPHHGTMKPNLEFIRRYGPDAWLAAQEKQWRCPGCGAGVMWYQKTCACGQSLNAWEVPTSFRPE